VKALHLAEKISTRETSFVDILEILSRRKGIIFLVVGLAMVAGIVLALRPRTFAASGAIRVQPGNASAYRTTTTLDTAQPEDKIASEVAILQSRSLYMQVARELNLANEPAIWKESEPKLRSLDDPKTRQRLGELMVDAIRVYHTPKDEIISINCTTRSPALSARIVNTLINDYVSYLFQMRLSSTKRTSKWLIGQLDDLKSQISQDQVSLVDLQGKLGVIGLDPRTSEFLATQSLDSFTKAASAATVDRIVAEAKYRSLRESDPNLIEGEVSVLPQGGSSTSSASLLENLRNSRATAAATYANLSARFGAKYPEVKQAKAQLDELDREVRTEQVRIMNQSKVAFQAARSNEKKTNAEVSQRRREVFQSHGSMVQYLTLLSDYGAHRTLYEGLVQRLREAGITSGLEAGEIDVVDLADVPALPVPPGPLTLLAGAMLVGLFSGGLTALSAEVLDPRITTLDQAERVTALPVLAEAPHVRRSVGGKGDAFSGVLCVPRSGYEESLQVLRTALLRAQPGSLPRILLVTSALPREGKTTTAINLAAVAAQHGQRVLLIDCDFHQGAFKSRFAVTSAKQVKGLTDVLAGHIALDQALWRPIGGGNLQILFGGSPPVNPSVLLGSDAMRHLLSICRLQFDVIVLDAPPVLGIADTLNLGVFAESVLVVLRSRLSTKAATRRMAKLLGASYMPVAGILLNDSRSMEREQSKQKYKRFYNQIEEAHEKAS
jgi:polysaccharide biosynthesis transport protein